MFDDDDDLFDDDSHDLEGRGDVEEEDEEFLGFLTGDWVAGGDLFGLFGF